MAENATTRKKRTGTTAATALHKIVKASHEGRDANLTTAEKNALIHSSAGVVLDWAIRTTKRRRRARTDPAEARRQLREVTGQLAVATHPDEQRSLRKQQQLLASWIVGGDGGGYTVASARAAERARAAKLAAG